MKAVKLMQGLVCIGLITCLGYAITMGTKSGKAGEQSELTFRKKITKVVGCNYLLNTAGANKSGL